MFDNIVNIALENSTISGNRTVGILEYQTRTKFKAHKRFLVLLAELLKENFALANQPKS